MNFKNFYKITLQKISEEIEKDNEIALNKKPLFESPMHHEAEFFNHLNDIKTNHPFAIEIMEYSKFIENVTINNATYKLYRTFEGVYTWDIFISGESGHELISAFIKYIPKGGMIVINGLWQINIVIGLVKGLINNYYSKHFSVLESDAVANNKGKKFYQNLAKEYIQQGKGVTVVINNKEIPYKLEDADSYWKSSDGVQSSDKRIRFYF